MILTDLPNEILLLILKHLPVSDIVNCRATNSFLKKIVDSFESTVYRQAAAHPSLHLIHDDHIFTEDFTSLGFTDRFLRGAGTWKDLCRRALEVRNNWLGKGPSRITVYNSTSEDIHRIKVDEKRGFIITTHYNGGLTVVDMNENTVIWALPGDYVRPYAHCEYAEGYLVFDRFGNYKEVWRLVSDDPSTLTPEAFQVVPESAPSADQIAAANNPQTSRNRRRFVPHALLRQSEFTRAYRFVYPTLLVAGGNALFLWDVRSGIMTERIDGIQAAAVVQNSPQTVGSAATPDQTQVQDIPNGTTFNADTLMTTVVTFGLANQPTGEDDGALGDINYVEVNEKYALICGFQALRVFRRRPPEGNEVTRNHTANCVLEVPRTENQRPGRWCFDVKYVKEEELPDDFQSWQERKANVWKKRKWKWVRNDKVVVSHSVTASNHCPDSAGFGPEFIAAHFSTCGQHIAGLLDNCQLVIIPYFERVVKGEVKSVRDIRIDIRLHAPLDSIYLAYEYGRIAVVTALAVFIIHPTFPDPSDLETSPSIEVVRVVRLCSPFVAHYVSCLQMTSTALWFNWEDTSMDDAATKEREGLWFEEVYGEVVDTGRSLGLPEPDALNSYVFNVDFGLSSN